MREFKFFQKKPERVFSDWMDMFDDYHLGGIVPDPPPTPSNPSYYDVDPRFRCVGVTPRRTNPDTYEPYRHLVYEDNDTGRMTQANIINTEHPMYNYFRQIDPEFYNSRYVDREAYRNRISQE